MVLEDKLLIWKLRGGSRDALRAIYRKYKDDLLRLAAGLLNDVSAAEDVVHDVFTGFIGSSREFRLRGSLKGYLATCVANRARNLNRNEHRRKTVLLDEAVGIGCDLDQPERWLIADEQFRRLTDALAQLPYEQREAIVLHLNGGLVFREIAKLQDASIKTVQSRYRYGLDKLRSVLADEVTK